MTPKGIKHRKARLLILTLLLAVFLSGATMPVAFGSGDPALATVNGIVRDNKGNPLAGVVIALLKEGANEIVKQTRSASDGSFVAKILPGRYSLRAEADGFNPASFPAVQIRQSDQLNYLFNLVPVGSGRTTPERRSDRDSAKWRLRSAQSRRLARGTRTGQPRHRRPRPRCRCHAQAL